MITLISRLITAWPQVARRMIANWQLMSTVVVGVLLASAIMAGTVIYFDALRELALKNALIQLSVNETNVTIKADRGPTTYTERDRMLRAVGPVIDGHVGWMLRDQTTGVKTATFFLSDIGREASADTDNPRTYFGHLPRLHQHITLLPGSRPPGDEVAPGMRGTVTIEALVPADAAREMDVDVGDRFAAVPYWNDTAPYIHAVVTGIFTRDDPDNEFWYLNDRVFAAATANSFVTLPFYVTEKSYYEVLGANFRQMDSTYSWLLMVEPDSLDARNATFARYSLSAMDNRLSSNLFRFRMITELEDTLAEYDKRLFFSKLPMFVILILIAVVIMYYVITLSSLVVEQHRGEIVLLKSRGANSVQVLSIFVLEGLTIAVLAVIFAPLMAGAVISLLGYVPEFQELSGGGRLIVHISSSAYMMSALGGLLSLAALMIPAVQASRMSVTTYRHQSARPYTQPVYQRYYLDVLLLVIGVILVRQLSEQGSVVAVGIFGEVAVDQILLAVPAVVLVASALVLLRLFPLFLRVSSALLSSFLSAGLVLGIWQMARNPTHYARLALLLILMAGLGIFAASFGGTLQRSFEERALYETGADVRLEGVLLSSSGDSSPMRTVFEDLQPVEDVTLAFRGFGSDLSKLLADSYTMFAVEGEKIREVGWFRDDFSESSMRSMLGSLASDTLPVGVEAPVGAVSIGVTFKPDRPHPSVAMASRIRDANGRYFTYIMGAMDDGEWQTMEHSLDRPGRRGRRALRPQSPVSVVSLSIFETSGRNRLRAGAMVIDEIFARMPDGDRRVLETFESLSEWSMLRSVPEADADLLKSADFGMNNSSAVNFIWGEGRPLVSRGIFHGPPLEPLPAIATSRFMKTNGHEVGDTIEVSTQGHRFEVALVGEMDYFPTLNTFTRSYLVTELASLAAYTNLEATGGELRPNEVWMTTNGQSNARADLIDDLDENSLFHVRTIHDREQVMADSQVDPLVQAGWRVLLFVAFASVLVLSGIGFMVHAYVSFKGREIQFALMRTVGFSMGQLTTLVLLEQVLVMGAGLALGTWMGGRLGATMMPFLGHDDQGTQVLPPFVVDVNWQTLGVTYAAMAIVFAIIITGVIFMVRRISLQRILRLGEV